MKRERISGFIVLVLACLLLFTGCTDKNSYFLIGTKEHRKELKNLFTILENPKTKRESRFIIIQQISRILSAENQPEILDLFLTSYVEKTPKDLYNAYYLLLVAQNYMKSHAYPFARHYYERILKNYPDLLVQGISIHYLCLKDLINLTDEPELKVSYFKELLSRFSGDINKGTTYYSLAKTYEQLGEWELSIQAYNNFLNYPNTEIAGVPDAWDTVKDMVDFYNFDGKDWTMESLDALTKEIRYAIHSKQASRVKKYMAKINFFTKSWEQGGSVKMEDQFITHISTFLGSRVWCSQTIDKDSNDQEAYLKTTGWSYRIQTWYLYFKKIYFPADPEKHGQWEWAGIYLGDKPFAGTKETR